jgi:hypothetical protein
MTDQHPITPPPELVQKWDNDWHRAKIKHTTLSAYIATQAARWGADQELEACCEWTTANFGELPGQNLHLYRRPKPPSLKEQALEALNEADQGLNESEWRQRSDTIRRALEALPDD